MPTSTLTSVGPEPSKMGTLAARTKLAVVMGGQYADGTVQSYVRYDDVEIVDPFIKSIPPWLLHVASQVTIVQSSGSDYLDRLAGIVRGRSDVLQKRMTAYWRAKPKEAKAEISRVPRRASRVDGPSLRRASRRRPAEGRWAA